MGLHKLVCAFAVGIVALSPTAARAQASSSAIAGSVKDTTGAVLPGVTVEAASPALIEKVRSVTTDARGEYKIVDLRPGTYTVTFTLGGFSTFKREGLDLVTGFTATVSAEMKVGSVSETITVTAATPVVDIQGSRAQSVLKTDVLEALPSGQRDLTQIVNLTLGATPSSGATRIDVGGTSGEMSTGITIHGSRGDDGRTNYDGMSTNVFFGGAGGQERIYKFNTVGVQETVIELGGATADTETGGANVNMIPKDGGNTLKFTTIDNFTNQSLASGKVPDDLIARGTPRDSNTVKKVYDFGAGIGGPIVKDRLWFYQANRWWGNQTYHANTYYNKSTNPLAYVPDLSRPAYEDQSYRDNGGRLTWQIAAKQKLAFSENNQKASNLQFIFNGSPESQVLFLYGPSYLTQVTWSSPVTNRLLFQAGAGFLVQAVSFAGNDGPPPANTHAILELVGVPGGAPAGFFYGAQGLGMFSPQIDDYGTPQSQNNFTERFSMAYVTGSHAFKAGIDTMQGVYDTHGRTLPDGLGYFFIFGRPFEAIATATPLDSAARVRSTGIYAQEQYTRHRLTVSGGIRIDHFWGFTKPITVAAGPFVPERTYAELKDVPNFKDATWRLGAAYDVFGTGKTAIKAYFGKYLLGQGGGDLNTVSPASSIVLTDGRLWNDANGNFTPECDFRNPAPNGECGQGNPNFGKPVQNLTWDANTRIGWGVREFNYQTSVQLQHELRPGMGVSVGYFRTDWHNQRVTVSNAVGRSDYSTFCYTSPSDSKLPDGGNQQICGLSDVSPAKVGLAGTDLHLTAADQFGTPRDIFNGVDMALNARWRNGALLQGGVALGQEVFDNCYLNAWPNVNATSSVNNQTTFNPKNAQFCKVKAPLWDGSGSQAKIQAIYPVGFGFNLAGTYKNLPGIPDGAVQTVSNAVIAPLLGRNLGACGSPTGACSASVGIPMYPSGTVFDSRFNQVDLRLTRSFTVGRGRLQGIAELYNVFNNRPATSVNTSYGTPSWLQPFNILSGRLFKFGGQFDY